MQKASAGSRDDAMTMERHLHREKSQAFVLGMAVAAIAGEDTTRPAPCAAPCLDRMGFIERRLNCAAAPR